MTIDLCVLAAVAGAFTGAASIALKIRPETCDYGLQPLLSIVYAIEQRSALLSSSNLVDFEATEIGNLSFLVLAWLTLASDDHQTRTVVAELHCGHAVT